MRNRFDMQLEQLNSMLQEMGTLCETAIREATDALQTGDQDKARAVIGDDAKIDQMERDIEQLCLTLLLQQQPVARDLRQISAALKMITDMERVGDQASDIAEILLTTEMTDGVNFPKLTEMSEEATRMVTDSISAYVNRDLELAGHVEANDDVVDLMFDSVKSELIDMIAEHVSADDDVETDYVAASRAIDLIMVAKYLERIGDHATNIAEWVAFSITGVHESASDSKRI